MADNTSKKEELKDIPPHPEQAEKEKKLLAAPDEVIAKAVREMMQKDHTEE